MELLQTDAELEAIHSDLKKYSIPIWQKDWNRYARDIIKVQLDSDQQEILHSVQHNRRTSVRSGNARGKDFVAAVASVCFLTLYYPSKVICTAPTGRQVHSIMMSEIKTMYNRARKMYDPGGLVLTDRIKMPTGDDHFLLGFKAGDQATESWSGFHSENILVVVTEASGIDDITFNAIEGVLQSNSRLLIVFNPNNLTGEAYTSSRSPLYQKFRLNCLNAPNVVNYKRVLSGEITKEQYEKIEIPGQVDWDWINEKVLKPGWVSEIPKNEAKGLDFEWMGKYYRPNDLARIKILGEFPLEAENALIPISWVEAAFERHEELTAKGYKPSEKLRLGVDVSGMGRDNTIFCHRYGNFVLKFTYLPVSMKSPTFHMEQAGRIVPYLSDKDVFALIDTIGEGAGIYSRLAEQGFRNAISAKASYSAFGLTDETEVRKFANMRAFMYWSLRNDLDPAFGKNLALPRSDMLLEELTAHTYELDSQGRIKIEKKEDIKERLGRSPDAADALSLTYFPETWDYKQPDVSASKESLGLF